MHPDGAPLEHAIGETTSRRTDIQTNFAFGRHLEFFQRYFEFQSATTHVTKRLPDFQVRAGTDRLARFPRLLVVNENLARQNSSLRAFTGLDQPALDQLHIKALLGSHSPGSS